MWFLLGCYLFSFLLPTGTCLECEFCSGMGRNCTGVMKTCAAEEDTCVIRLEQIFQASIMATYNSKDCGRSSECSLGTREIDFGNRVGVRMNRVCCTGDACKTASAPVLPPLDSKPNGFQCPGCLGIFSTECYESPVACTGSNTQCLELAGKIKYYSLDLDIAVKGCASDGICHNLEAGLHNFGRTSADLFLANCTIASSASNQAP